MTRFHFAPIAPPRGLPTSAVAAAVCTLLLCVPVVAFGQSQADLSCDSATSTTPCGFQWEGVEIQKVPTVFKFQARIAQSKLPVGDGTFDKVWVKILSGGTTMCIEAFTNVLVKDSVLNLSIGASDTPASCDLQRVIAESGDLQFQVCLGSLGTCLTPVKLGTTPYAVKSSYAARAEQAATADRAGVASFAHRITADAAMFLRKTLGVGYFDFETPTGAGWPSDPDIAQGKYADSAFLLWTPVRTAAARFLHIGARAFGGAVGYLDQIVLLAQELVARGTLTVTGRSASGGNLGPGSPAAVVQHGDLRVLDGHITASGDATVGGKVTIAGIDVSRDPASAKTLDVQSDVAITGTLYGASSGRVEAGFVVGGGLTVGTGATVTAGALTVNSGLINTVGGAPVRTNTDIVSGTGVYRSDNASIKLDAGGVDVVGNLTVRQNAEFKYLPTVNGQPLYVALAASQGGTVTDTNAVHYSGSGATKTVSLLDADVNGRYATFNGLSITAGRIDVNTDFWVGGHVHIDGAASLIETPGRVRALNGVDVGSPGGSATALVNGTLTVSQGTILGSNLAVGGSISSGVNLSVAGTTTLSGALNLSAGLNMTGGSSVSLKDTGGTTAIQLNGQDGHGTFRKLTSGDGTFSGALSAGSLNLSGGATISGGLTVNGNSYFAGGAAKIEGGVLTLANAPGLVKGFWMGENQGAAVLGTQPVRIPFADRSSDGGNPAVPYLEVGVNYPRIIVRSGLELEKNLAAQKVTAYAGLDANCRICLAFSDNNSTASYRTICAGLYDGASSGWGNLKGDVNGDDAVHIFVQCGRKNPYNNGEL